MFFLLYTLITLIPLVLSLNITLESAPEAFQSTPVSLRQDDDDPFDFVLGAFTVDGNVAASANLGVANFTADSIVNMTFNHTSSSGKDCILLAWLPQAQSPNSFAESEPFSVTSGTTTTTPSDIIPIRSPFPSTSRTSSPSSPTGLTSSPTTSSFTSSVSATASNIPPKPTSHTGVIVGGVLGLLALGCMVSASIYVLRWRRRSRAGSLPLPHPQDSPVPPLTPFILKYSSPRETGAQEHVSAVSRDHLEAEIAGVREEIRALRLDNQIRRVEAGYESLPPPSYRSASSSSRSISFDT
ncbi:uncharacterized protein ARMOST_08023 [Armillaria ostoyae]|uniref:Mid2 domain-containing protein n=1 Tax=Armillaria ostoyae TaxID=47428 RepID=A0A284R7F0_ARMOS|nr:uncharacterized protein ARMOST_08023 [Armillaria ostoyae]